MVLNLYRVNHIRTASFDMLPVSFSQTFHTLNTALTYINFTFLYNLEQALARLVICLSILIRILMLLLHCILSKKECHPKGCEDPLCNVDLLRESRFFRTNENEKSNALWKLNSTSNYTVWSSFIIMYLTNFLVLVFISFTNGCHIIWMWIFVSYQVLFCCSFSHHFIHSGDKKFP